jgi:hypothetical protein
MRKFRYYATVTAVLFSSLVLTGTTGAQTCSSDCGVYPDDTPADVARLSQKSNGDWVGPVYDASGNSFAH